MLPRYLGTLFVVTALLLTGTLSPSAQAESLSVSVPSVAVTRTDSPLTLSSLTFDGLSVAGTWQGTEAVTLEIDGGHWSLGVTEGLTFQSGDGVDDATMTFSGSFEAVNAALEGATLTPPPGFAGALTATLSVEGETSAVASWRVSVNALIDADAARAAILNGVTQIHSGVQPGRMVAYGPEAYDITWYEGKPKEGPMVAVASMGAGRVIAMPDHQMLNMIKWLKMLNKMI